MTTRESRRVESRIHEAMKADSCRSGGPLAANSVFHVLPERVQRAFAIEVGATETGNRPQTDLNAVNQDDIKIGSRRWRRSLSNMDVLWALSEVTIESLHLHLHSRHKPLDSSLRLKEQA